MFSVCERHTAIYLKIRDRWSVSSLHTAPGAVSHSQARAAVPLAPAAALLGFLCLLLLVLDHLGMVEHRLDGAGHVVGLMACNYSGTPRRHQIQ